MSEFTFTDQNFKTEVESAKVAVLVDFWAPWCGPCKVQGPIVEELAQEMAGQEVKIGKLNVEENLKVSSKYQIMSIPTIIIFKDGRPVEQLVGIQEFEDLKEKLKKLVS